MQIAETEVFFAVIPPPYVFVIEDPRTGDLANALALGQLISDRLGAEVEVKRIAMRSDLLLPFVLLAVLTRARGRWRNFLQKLLFRGEPIGDARPVAVVSTLGRGEPAGVFVSSLWNAPLVHLGSPKRLPSRYFAAVLTHPGHVPKASEIDLPVTPTRVPLRPRHDTKIAKLCLLLGGNTKGGTIYRPEFWSRCVAAAMDTADAHNAALTIATSPRTGPSAELIVEEAVNAAGLPNVDLILHGRVDRRDVAAEIVSADAVLVTADSISMVSDAISSGGLVLALYDDELPVSSRTRAFLSRHQAERRLKLVGLARRDAGALDVTGITPETRSWKELVWPPLERAIMCHGQNRKPGNSSGS